MYPLQFVVSIFFKFCNKPRNTQTGYRYQSASSPKPMCYLSMGHLEIHEQECEGIWQIGYSGWAPKTKAFTVVMGMSEMAWMGRSDCDVLVRTDGDRVYSSKRELSEQGGGVAM